MRSLLALSCSLALTATSLAQGWPLNAPYESRTTLTWAITLQADLGGQSVETKMKQFLEIESRTDRHIVGKTGWTDLQVDGNSTNVELPTWPVTLAPNGSILTAGDGPDFVRQLAPTTFIYPAREVKVGDKWTGKFRAAKDAKEARADYEVIEQTVIHGAEVLKIRGKLNEEDGLQSDGTYWLGRDGRVLKFDIQVKQWPVVGAQMPPIGARLTGELVK